MSRLKVIVGVGISLVLFGYLFWSVDLPELGRQLAGAQWGWVLASMVLGPIGVWTRGRRWWYLFPAGSNPPGLVPATMIGYMVNNVLPLRAGEFVRVYVVARRWGHGFWTTLATLIVERVLDSLVIVLAVVVLVLRTSVPRTLEIGAIVLLMVDVVAVTALGVLAVSPASARRLIERLTRRWPAVERRVEGTVTTFARGLEGVRTRTHLLPLLLWTVIVWIIPAAIAWTMFRALHLELPWIAGWAVIAFVGLGIAIPSAPGYVGVFHAAATLALTMFGVPTTAAFGYALLLHATQLVPITIVGWIYLLREHVSLTEATHARPVPASD